MCFVFAVLNRWSVPNENVINILYFFERVDNFVGSYSPTHLQTKLRRNRSTESSFYQKQVGRTLGVSCWVNFLEMKCFYIQVSWWHNLLLVFRLSDYILLLQWQPKKVLWGFFKIYFQFARTNHGSWERREICFQTKFIWTLGQNYSFPRMNKNLCSNCQFLGQVQYPSIDWKRKWLSFLGNGFRWSWLSWDLV